MTGDRDNTIAGSIIPLLEDTMAELDLIGASYDMSLYEMDPEEEGNDWPGIIVYDEENGDLYLTCKPCETDNGIVYILYMKAWTGEEKKEDSDEVSLYYKEWCFPLLGKEMKLSYLGYVIKLFNKARKGGSLEAKNDPIPRYIKETARLNGLRNVLEEIGVPSYYSFEEGSFPCLWIFDGYEDDDSNENAGCLIRLSYISIDENDSIWLLMVECSRTSDEKIYPSAPVLKEPISQLILPESGGLLDSLKYGQILEIIENMTFVDGIPEPK